MANLDLISTCQLQNSHRACQIGAGRLVSTKIRLLVSWSISIFGVHHPLWPFLAIRSSRTPSEQPSTTPASMKASPCRRGDLVELGLGILVINIWHTTVSDKMKMNIMEASTNGTINLSRLWSCLASLTCPQSTGPTIVKSVLKSCGPETTASQPHKTSSKILRKCSIYRIHYDTIVSIISSVFFGSCRSEIQFHSDSLTPMVPRGRHWKPNRTGRSRGLLRLQLLGSWKFLWRKDEQKR